MGKVGILTFHDTTNFGATLQAVATYYAIRDLGYDVEIIDYRCNEIDRREIPAKKYDFSNGSLKGLIYFLLSNGKHQKKYKLLHDFLWKETKVSKRYDKSNISTANKEYDCFVVGSDMLWYFENTCHDYTYLLDFVEDNRKKIAFATSMGHCLKQEDEKDFILYLNDFENIAVREEELSKRIASMLKRDIYHVCDPTMLISPKIWEKYAVKKNIKKYALVYMDTEKGVCLKDACAYANANGTDIRLARFKNPMKHFNSYKTAELYSIEDFLSEIANASIVYTASYHGMLFALYFHIPVVYYNKDSTRLQGIAKILNIEYRNGDQYNHLEMKDIDWKNVDEKRKEFCDFSKDILKGVLSRNENM